MSRSGVLVAWSSPQDFRLYRLYGQGLVGGGNPVMAKQVTKMAVEPDSTADESARFEPENQQEIATLAYEFWQTRGCPDGSPEEDWFRAERELQGRRERRLKAA